MRTRTNRKDRSIMSDQQAPASADTPAVAGPTEAPGTAQEQPQSPAGFIEEQRYKDLQAEYTRNQQSYREAQEREQWYRELVTSDDPDTQRRAAEILGFELPDTDDEIADEEGFEPEGYVDPNEQLLQRLEALEGRLSSEDQARQQAAENDFIGDWAHAQFDELGIDREDEQTRAFIFNQALGLPRLRPQPGMPAGWLPDIKAAHEQFMAWRDQQVSNWARTKRAPHVPPGGLPANEVPNSGTGQQARLARAMNSLRNSLGEEYE